MKVPISAGEKGWKEFREENSVRVGWSDEERGGRERDRKSNGTEDEEEGRGNGGREVVCSTVGVVVMALEQQGRYLKMAPAPWN